MTSKTSHSNKITKSKKFLPGTVVEKETIEFLQMCIQTDTSNPPGNEIKLAKKIQEKFENENNPIIHTKIIETEPRRGNLIVDIEGSDPENHDDWGFASHLDVVPIENPKDWKYPPFSGKVVELEHDRFIWGRGAMDMKQIGTSYTMAILTLLREGFQPKGNIKLIFESDEEKGGKKGMKILVDKYWEDIKVDFLITEGGGYQLPLGKDFAIQIGEKGKCQTKIEFSGVSGHGSTPDPLEKFAVYKLVHVLEKIREHKSELFISKEFKNTIDALSLPRILKFLLKRKSILRGLLSFISKRTGVPFKKFFIPMITDTITPTIIRAGKKVNVISPHAELSLDIRTLPGHNHEYIYNKLEEIIGAELFNELTLSPIDEVNSTTSPVDTKYYRKLRKTLEEFYPGANLVPIFDVAGTDMKHVRKKGIPCYGFSLLLKDQDLTFDELLSLAHAPNERISVSNLMAATEFIYNIMRKV